jgi:hypothetical protein
MADGMFLSQDKLLPANLELRAMLIEDGFYDFDKIYKQLALPKKAK